MLLEFKLEKYLYTYTGNIYETFPNMEIVFLIYEKDL